MARRHALILAGALCALAPSVQSAPGTITFAGGSACTSFDSFTWSENAKVLTVQCATVPACATQATTAIAIQGQGGTRPSVPVNGSVVVTFVRSAGGCAGAYRLTYGVGAVSLSGWAFNGKTTNGYVDFPAGQTSVTATFNAGTKAGVFLLQLASVSPAGPTLDKRDFWIDVR